ncbi:MAG: cytochrome ubiquinol oxidase subunit I [Adlercreutzia equolifaciens]
MEAFADVAVLSRIQFALTVAYHFLFVPLSIGLGLILAINETRYCRRANPRTLPATKFWVKVFTATFAIGVATGITMEFSFGTNWAELLAVRGRYLRSSFGRLRRCSPFFLESVFLGVAPVRRKSGGRSSTMVSRSSCGPGHCTERAVDPHRRSSWMQTPAGARLAADGTDGRHHRLLLRRPSTRPLRRYTHTRGRRCSSWARSWPWPWPAVVYA